jgi:hypothetical protein
MVINESTMKRLISYKKNLIFRPISFLFIGKKNKNITEVVYEFFDEFNMKNDGF